MPIRSFESLLTQLTHDNGDGVHSVPPVSTAEDSQKRRAIPLVESRIQFMRVLEVFDAATNWHVRALFLRHCNLFELTDLVEQALRLGIATYVNIDHIDGIHPDIAGIRYLAETMHVQGILSNNPRILALGKSLGLETIQRIFALDSTGLDTALESVDVKQIDLLDISPALVVPYIAQTLKERFVADGGDISPHDTRPFIASGLIHTSQQVASVLQSGAAGVIVTRDELWH
jgi:glycerol uptake operon antiterminator